MSGYSYYPVVLIRYFNHLNILGKMEPAGYFTDAFIWTETEIVSPHEPVAYHTSCRRLVRFGEISEVENGRVMQYQSREHCY